MSWRFEPGGDARAAPPAPRIPAMQRRATVGDYAGTDFYFPTQTDELMSFR